MQVGDLVKYIPYGHTESTGCIGVIVGIDDYEYKVHFTDGEVMCDLIFSELEAVCK